MRRWRDIGSEMFEPVIDARTEEKMFRGLLEPHEAPVGFAGVAVVLRSAVAAGMAVASPDRARKQRIVSSMVSIICSDHPSGFSVAVPPPTLRAGSRRGPVPFLPRLRLVAVAVVGFLFASMGLAFAGALPGPAQNVASSLLSHVGIHVPNGHGMHATTHSSGGGSGGAPDKEPGSGSRPVGRGSPTEHSGPRHGHHGRYGHGNEGDHGHHHHDGDHRHGNHGHGNGNGNGRGQYGHADNGRRSHGRGRSGDSGSHDGGHGHSSHHGSNNHD